MTGQSPVGDTHSLPRGFLHSALTGDVRRRGGIAVVVSIIALRGRILVIEGSQRQEAEG